MIEAKIGSEIVISGLSEDEKATLQNGLTILNPKWDIATRMNKSLWGIPAKLKYYRVDGDNLIIPVGVLDTFKEMFPQGSIVDDRYEAKKKLNLTFKGTLRDYQEDAVKAMERDPNGVLCAKTGSGKTVMIIKLICDIKQPALILVHTVELANQFTEALLKFTDLTREDIGRLGNGKKDLKPITVGLLQTVTTMDPTTLNKRFGLVFVDEVHIAPADTYATALGSLRARYKYGASGTPERADGLTKVIFWLTGPLRHMVPDSALADVIIKPEIKTIDTNYYFPLFDTSEYQEMITDLSKDAERNKLIIDTYKAQAKDKQSVFLCQRKEQVEQLQKLIPKSVILTSDMGKKSREAVMKGLLDGTHKVVISTFQLFSTGIDIPTLEILFICAPIKSNVKVRQSAGRLMRTTPALPNKKPLIIDFADKKVELLKHQWYQRNKILKTL